MINSICGTITQKGDGWICIENQGIEWQLVASSFTIAALPAMGNQGRVYTWLYHKEDQMVLYGFIDPKERSLFMDLISVSGVGPKGALKILSAARPQQLLLYLEEENLDSLASLPGLGKKTAQKILLQLRGKLSPEEELGTSGGPEGEWVESLSAMGFERKQVQRVLKGLLSDPLLGALDKEAKEREILRRAIRELSS